MARLVVTDSLGCQAASATTVDMKVHDLPRLVISPDSPYVCLNSSTTLTASGGSSYLWSPATGLDRADVPAPVASPTMNTTYQVLTTDDVGCQSTASVLVKVTAPQSVTVTPDTASICQGDELRMVEKGADVYRWIGDIDGTGGSGVILAKPMESTVFMVIGTDFHACFADTVRIPVTVRPVPTVNAGPDVEVLAGDPVTLAATGSADIVQWAWTPADYLSCTGCAQPVASPKKPEDYILKVTNDVGCSAKDTVVAKIICEEARVKIPDAFSPNGDGANDRFVILGIGLVRHIVIFDRWGVKVWERSDFYPADAISCWDGTIHGQPAPVGSYVYFVEMECPAGGVFSRRGTVVLVR
jgi:gliding motility-associated-like protein